jgi:hypothetical protein
MGDEKLTRGQTFVWTNNDEAYNFPFEKKAFKGILFTALDPDRGKSIQNSLSLSIKVTFEDTDGLVKDSGEFEVQNSKLHAFGQLKSDLMPWW